MTQSVAIDPSVIRARAYARWQERGCPTGCPEHDWLEAERELTQERLAGARALQLQEAAPAREAAVSRETAQSSAPPESKRAQPPRPTLKREQAPRSSKPPQKVAAGGKRR